MKITSIARIFFLSFCFMILWTDSIFQGNASFFASPSFENQPIEEEIQISGAILNSGNQKVMLQGFYWEVLNDGHWWNIVAEEAEELADVGFDSIWLPPPQKTKIGMPGYCGYEPFDYWDLGEFNQQNGIRTLYGTREELQSLIDKLDTNNITAIADIVMNHCNGGNLEYNPLRDEFTPTNFMNVESGKFLRNYTHFHSNIGEDHDRYAFGSFPDFNHSNIYVHDEFIKWGTWLRDSIGFDGWRFDVALGIIPEMIRDWMNNNTGFGVVEYWSGRDMTVNEQLEYLDAGNNTFACFDFPLMYELRRMCIPSIAYDMRNLIGAGLVGVRPEQAVTFVTNHDTFRQIEFAIPEQYRMMGYAYILSHKGYPMIYWDDYFNVTLNREMKALISVHNNYANGPQEILFCDEDVYVMQRTGDLGLLLVINENASVSKQVSIPESKWVNSFLYDALGHLSPIKTGINGNTTIELPPYSYGIFTPNPSLITWPDIVPNEIIKISKDQILIDGKPDIAWVQPILSDRMGDSGFSQKDLQYLFLSTDEEYLYIGFNIGNRNSWTTGNIDYGIAFNTKLGGNRYDPGLHTNVSWTGRNLPDYLFYYSNNINNSMLELNNGSMYAIDSQGKWNYARSLVPNVDFVSSPAYSFSEIRIPLNEIDLDNGGTFQLKIFSSPVGQIGASDSVPYDSEVSNLGDQVAWLSLNDTFIISPISHSKTSSTNPSSANKFTINGFLGECLFLGTIISIIYIFQIRKLGIKKEKT